MRGEERHVPRKINKSEADRRVVRGALQEGTVLSALSEHELEEMIDFMEVVQIRAGQSCNLSGALCVVLEGTVSTNPQMADAESFTTGRAFGQVGLFQDMAREVAVEGGALVVQADISARICKLAGTTYRASMEFSRQAQIKANMKLLVSIPIFEKMSVMERVRICDGSQVVTYRQHDVIITEGEPGDTFYILRSGGAKVFREDDNKRSRSQIDYKYSGDFFGEAALLTAEPRNATVVADKPNTECLLVDKKLFNEQLLGPLQDIMDRSESTLQQQMVMSVPLLAQLPADKRHELSKRINNEKFKDGQFLFKQGGKLLHPAQARPCVGYRFAAHRLCSFARRYGR